jgi:hypothetical protein
LTAAALVLTVLGCTTVQHVRPAGEVVPSETLAILWVTNEYNEVIPVGHPRLAGDSLVGTWVGVGEPVAIPLTGGADVRKFDGTRTALLGLGVTAGTVLLLMLNGGSGEGGTGNMGSMCDMDMMEGCM